MQQHHNPQKTPKIQFDWTLNVSNIITVILFLIGGIGAWYDVKYEVSTNQKEAVLKFNQIDKFIELQRLQDQSQDASRDKLLADIRDGMREQGREIKQEIRDFRNDLTRSRTLR